MTNEKLFRAACAIHGDQIIDAAKKIGVTHAYLYRYFGGECSPAVELRIVKYVNEAIEVMKTIQPLKEPANVIATPFSSEFIPPSPYKTRRARLANAQS